MPAEQLMELMHSRARRRFSRGLKRKPMALVKKLRKAKKEAPVNEKPDIVKTHLRNMIIVPEMVGSIVGVYNGKAFNQVEVKVMKVMIDSVLTTKKIIVLFHHSIYTLLKLAIQCCGRSCHCLAMLCCGVNELSSLPPQIIVLAY